jgi:hypothetical protein
LDPTALTVSVVSRFQATPTESAVVVIGGGWLVLGALLVWSLVRSRHDRRLARDAARTLARVPATLRPGPATIVGRVDCGSEGPAVTVRIHQVGKEWHEKGGWRHKWTEDGREVTARPFHVIRPSGERIRVEPDTGVFLVDRLDGFDESGRSATTRVRTATLTADEPVCVTGTLVAGFDPEQGGYRDSASGPILRPLRSTRMLISTEPLADRHKRAARDHLLLAMATLLVMLVAHGLVFARFNVLSLFGKRVELAITGHSSNRFWIKPKNSRGYWEWHYTVDAGNLRDECSSIFYDEVEKGSRVTAPFLVAGDFGQLGWQPTESDDALIWFVFFVIGYMGAAASWVLSRRPWWDRARIRDRGDGRLHPDTISVG